MNKTIEIKSIRGVVFICYCLIIVFTLLFIFNNSSLPKTESAAQSRELSGFLQSILDPFNKMTPEHFDHLVRKLAHFVEFGALGFEFALLAFHLSFGFKTRDAVYSAFVALLCANFDELLQSFTERGSLISDVFIDFAGSVCGIIAGYIAAVTVRAIYRKIKAKKRPR